MLYLTLGLFTMPRLFARLTVSLLVGLCAACAPADAAAPVPSATPQAPPAPQFPVSGMTYPADFRERFVQYATVERSDGTSRDLYIHPDALRRYSVGRALPEGTIIVIEGYHALPGADGRGYQTGADGRYQRGEPLEAVHVIEKRGGWRDTDFVSELRAGGWNFGTFDARSGQPFNENTISCFNCHNGTPQTDFLQSRALLDRYAVSGLVQYFYCDLPGRLGC